MLIFYIENFLIILRNYLYYEQTGFFRGNFFHMNSVHAWKSIALLIIGILHVHGYLNDSPGIFYRTFSFSCIGYYMSND